MCGLIQSEYDDFDFSRQSGRTGTSNTGPSTDHTTLSDAGHYIYIETSYPQLKGDVAQVMTPVFKGSAPKCRLTFAYHMFGSGIGDLEVCFTINSRSF